MRKTIKNLIIVVLAVALVVQAVEFVQARPYVLGGQQDTYYSILACTDGLRFDVGLYVPNAPSTPKASFSRVDYRSESILDGASFPLNGPSNVTIQDGQSGASIMLSHTGSFTVPWPNGANDPTIMPGRAFELSRHRSTTQAKTLAWPANFGPSCNPARSKISRRIGRPGSSIRPTPAQSILAFMCRMCPSPRTALSLQPSR